MARAHAADLLPLAGTAGGVSAVYGGPLRRWVQRSRPNLQVQGAVPQNGESAMRLAVTAGPSANGLCNLVRETGWLTEAVSVRRGAGAARQT